MSLECIFGHNKKYVAIRFEKLPWPGKCWTLTHHYHYDDKVYTARWACQRCPKLGEKCLGNKQDWAIEFGKIVADVKKWSNWSGKDPK